LLYPSLCFFEGTPVSVGRGTTHAFACVGLPGEGHGLYHFQPKEVAGSKVQPLYAGQACTGLQWITANADSLFAVEQIDWDILLHFYEQRTKEAAFFKPFFDKLAGGPWLRAQIEAGKSAEEIRKGYATALAAYKQKRKPYLLYAE
jgi:uncharacterized protein YbbC (DUF1343 family)